MILNNDCVEQETRNKYIEMNFNKALEFLENVPIADPEEELLFLNILINNVNNTTALPYVVRKELQKDYADYKGMLNKTGEVKAADVLQEFDNMLMQQVATGLLEVPSVNFEKLYVNEDQFERVSSYAQRYNNGSSCFRKGSRK